MKFHEFTRFSGSKKEPVLVDLDNISMISREPKNQLPGHFDDWEGKARLHFKAAAEDRMKSVLLAETFEDVKRLLVALNPS